MSVAIATMGKFVQTIREVYLGGGGGWDSEDKRKPLVRVTKVKYERDKYKRIEVINITEEEL